MKFSKDGLKYYIKTKWSGLQFSWSSNFQLQPHLSRQQACPALGLKIYYPNPTLNRAIIHVRRDTQGPNYSASSSHPHWVWNDWLHLLHLCLFQMLRFSLIQITGALARWGCGHLYSQMPGVSLKGKERNSMITEYWSTGVGGPSVFVLLSMVEYRNSLGLLIGQQLR